MNNDLASLEKLITNIQTNVYFTITIVVAILTLSVGVAGWALSVLAKQWVNKQVEKELGQIDSRINRLVKGNQQFHYARGNVNLHDGKIHIAGLSDFSRENIVSVTVISKHGQLLERNVIIDKNGYITIELFGHPDFTYVQWTITWIPTSTFEDVSSTEAPTKL